MRFTIESHCRNYIEGPFLLGVVGDSTEPWTCWPRWRRLVRRRGSTATSTRRGRGPDEALAKAAYDGISANVELPVQDPISCAGEVDRRGEGAMGFIKAGIDQSKERGRRSARSPLLARARR